MVSRPITSYKEIASTPNVVRGRITHIHESLVNIEVEYSYQQIETGRMKAIMRNASIYIKEGHIEWLFSTPNEVPFQMLAKVSQKQKLANIRREREASGNWKNYLSVWKNGRRTHCYDLSNNAEFGEIYYDRIFGCLNWNASETQVVFVAEKKSSKPNPHLERHPCADSMMTNHIYNESLGEGYDKMSCPSICVADVNTGMLSGIKHVPDIVCGQLIFVPDSKGLIGVGWKPGSRKYGVQGFNNRESFIFYVTFEGKYRVISDENVCARSPRMNPDGHSVIYLENDVGGAHYRTSRLMKYDFHTSERRVVVPCYSRNAPIEEGESFSGIYTDELPENCFIADGQALVFNSIKHNQTLCYVCNIATGKLQVAGTINRGSVKILDTCKDFVLGATSDILHPHTLLVGRVRDDRGSFVVEWISAELSPTDSEGEIHYLEFMNPTAHPDSVYTDLVYHGIVITPFKKSHSPLVVILHGGPHSAMTDEYDTTIRALIKCGYAALIVNYRGSIGNGEDSIVSLIGLCGMQDVKDVIYAIEYVLKTFSKEVDADRVSLMGYSYGGFSCLHAMGQHANLFKCCILINPITDLFSMIHTTDVPDWLYNEFQLGKMMAHRVTSIETLSKLWKMSPSKYLPLMKTPTLILVGENDRRVTPYEGITLHNILRTNMVKTKLLHFNDGHDLTNPCSQYESFISMVWWLDEHLKSLATDDKPPK